MTPEQCSVLGDEFFAALQNRTVVAPPTERFADITIDDAYRVSSRILERRQAAGEVLVGRKIGLTNPAVQKHFGIDHPDFGNLTDAMRFDDGADVPVSQLLIQPRIEGEIAFVLKSGLKGPGVSTEDVLAATDYVAACFEIVDSRVRDWQITIADTIADNGSSGLFVLSAERTDPNTLDLSDAAMIMTQEGETVSEGTGAAAMGSPLNCVAWLANVLGSYDDELRAGDVVLSGSLGAVIPARAGAQLQLSISGIGEASVRLT